MRYTLKPSIAVEIAATTDDSSTATFLFEGGRRELVLELDKDHLTWLAELRGSGVDEADPRLEMFRDRAMLMSADLRDRDFGPQASDLLNRQRLLFLDMTGDDAAYDSAWSRVKAARIAIVGLGGIGSNVLNAFVRMGIADFMLIDPDKVEPSNLNRQSPFVAEDVGRLKVEAAASYAGRVRGGLQIDSRAAHILDVGPECFEGRHVINCADVPDILSTSRQIFARSKKFLSLTLGGGYYSETSFIGPILLPGESALLDEIARQAGSSSLSVKHISGVGGNAFSTALLPASIASFEVLKLIAGIGAVNLRKSLRVFDWRTLQMHTIELSPS